MKNILTNILLYPFLFLFSVNCLAQNVEIWEIQGTGNSSPLLGGGARSENNIVTNVSDDFFVIQTPDNRSDNTIQSSDALVVFEDNINVKIGDMVTVEGAISESSFGTTILVVTNNPTQIISSNNALPTATLLDADFPIADNDPVPAWEWVESMLIDLSNFKVTAPSNEDGYCSVSPSVTRPFREAGIEFPSNNASVPEWDGNPEVLLFFPDGFGLSPNTTLGAGMELTGLGMVFGEPQDYAIYPITYSVSGAYKQQAVRPKEAMEASIGNINALFLLQDDFNYNFRVEKMAQYIHTQMHAPDIVAFQEVGDMTVLEDIAEALLDIDISAEYSAYLRKGSGSIHTGFLIKKTLSNIEIQQLGENETLSLGGRLHDRPPLLLEAQFNTNPPTPIAVLNVHLRSLNGITGSDQNYVRTKRHEGAVSVSEMVKALQLQYDNIVVLGDFNAFQFSDGYVDVLNQITGQPSLGAQFSVENVLDMPLVNQSLSVAPAEQYSYVFRGNAQVLDHCLTTSNMQGMRVDELQYVRGNADSPETFLASDPVLRVSDHDGFVLFLDLEDTLSVLEPPVVVPPSDIAIAHPNPFQVGNLIQFNLPQKENLTYQIIAMNGVIIQAGNLGAIQNEHIQLDVPASIVEGIYILKIQGNRTEYVTKLYVVE